MLKLKVFSFVSRTTWPKKPIPRLHPFDKKENLLKSPFSRFLVEEDSWDPRKTSQSQPQRLLKFTWKYCWKRRTINPKHQFFRLPAVASGVPQPQLDSGRPLPFTKPGCHWPTSRPRWPCRPRLPLGGAWDLGMGESWGANLVYHLEDKDNFKMRLEQTHHGKLTGLRRLWHPTVLFLQTYVVPFVFCLVV